MRSEVVMQDIDNNNVEVAIGALGKSIARLTEKNELYTTAVPGLSLFRRIEPTEPITGMYEPSVCLVAQGAKRVLLVTDKGVRNAGLTKNAEAGLIAGGCELTVFEDVEADPPSHVIERAVALCRDKEIELVASIGGGALVGFESMISTVLPGSSGEVKTNRSVTPAAATSARKLP